jgi:hypothetical protein
MACGLPIEIDRWRVQDGRIDRADLQFDHPRVLEFLGQRNVLPAEAGCAHVDRNRPVRMFAGVEDAGDGLEGEGLLAGFGGQGLDDAAHAVAAGLRTAAVGIQDVDEEGGAGRAASWMAMIWSKPVAASALSATAAAGVTRSARPRISATMISLPMPFILAKGAVLAMAPRIPVRLALYGGNGRELPVRSGLA